MKKYILLILSLFVFGFAYSQFSFKATENYKTYNGVAGDTLNASYLLEKSIYLGLKDFKYDYYIEADLDSAGDATDITCRLRGSMNGVNWTNIGDAITWYLTTSDTTIIYSSLTKTNTATATIAAYVQIHSGTSGIAAYEITASDSIIYTDTLNVAAQTITYTDTINVAAQTITTSESYQDGLSWRYLELYFLGAGAGSDMSIPTTGKPIRIRIIKYE